MKHAIQLLEHGLDNARKNERQLRQEKDLKGARQCQAQAWECLDAIELLRLSQAEKLAAKKLAAKKGATKP